MKKIVLLFLIMPFFSIAQSFTLKIDLPQKFEKNKNYNITVEISKLDFTQFGEFFIVFPQGIKINKITTKADKIKQQSNSAKIYWAQMPHSEKIKIQISINFSDLKSDGKILYGFEYQANNQRGFIKGTPILIKKEQGNFVVKRKENKNIASNNKELKEVYNFFSE